MTDQQRADCLQMAGHPVLQTPSLDRLEERAVRFSHAFTAAPLCVPSRCAAVTGQYPHNTQVWENYAQLSEDCQTVMHRLRDSGYRNACIGKLHLCWEWQADADTLEDFVRRTGFEDIVQVLGAWSCVKGQCIYTDYLEKHGLRETFARYYVDLHNKPELQRRFTAEVGPLAAEHVIDAFIGRSAIDYIDHYDDSRPSFLFVGFSGPHEPWDAPQPYATMYDPDSLPEPIAEKQPGAWLSPSARAYGSFAQYFKPPYARAIKEVAANYFGKITLIDEWIGKILDAYERRDWLDQTLVIFSSDHGEMLGDHNHLSKSVFYESALRTPLLIKPPGGRTGTLCDAMVQNIDLAPTILDVVGADPLESNDGRSLLPLIRGQSDCLHCDVLSEVHEHTMLRSKDWKIVADRTGQTLQLFDLVHDPLEQVNLAGHEDYRQTEAEMRDRLLRKLLSTQFRRRAGKTNVGMVPPL